MAKKHNKSAAIRAALEQNPKAKSKEIVATLAEKGMKVAPTLVYYIKSRAKRLKRKQKRERIAATSRGMGSANPVELVLQVKRVAQSAGGMKNLKQLVDALAE